MTNKPSSLEPDTPTSRTLHRGRVPPFDSRSPPRQVGDVRLDPAECRAWRGPLDLHLTRTEFALLWVLAATPGQAQSRPALTRQVWGNLPTDNTNLVDVSIRRLRRKLEPDPAHPAYIRTMRPVGYLLDER